MNLNKKERSMKWFRILFVVVLVAMTSEVACCAQIWPCPGVCFTDGAYFPDLEKGVVFLDLGLPQTERPSVYGDNMWHHPDLKNVAHRFVHPLFQKIVRGEPK